MGKININKLTRNAFSRNCCLAENLHLKLSSHIRISIWNFLHISETDLTFCRVVCLLSAILKHQSKIVAADKTFIFFTTTFLWMALGGKTRSWWTSLPMNQLDILYISASGVTLASGNPIRIGKGCKVVIVTITTDAGWGCSYCCGKERINWNWCCNVEDGTAWIQI